MVSPIQAQQAGVVTGTVRDATTLEPLSGVQVTIVGGGIGALSDTQGGFLLDGVPEGSVEVRLERLGYETSVQSVTVTAGQTVSIDFALSVSVLSLDEMIITVTGLQRRREIGNATTTIDVEEEVRRGIPEGILGLLQGRVSGVQVLQSSGSVGATPSITIRGSSSILLDDTPIIYVDGTRVSNDLASGPDVGGQDDEPAQRPQSRRYRVDRDRERPIRRNALWNGGRCRGHPDHHQEGTDRHERVDAQFRVGRQLGCDRLASERLEPALVLRRGA